MGDQNPTTTARVLDQGEEIIAIDPDYQSTATEASLAKPVDSLDRIKKPKVEKDLKDDESTGEGEKDEKKKDEEKEGGEKKEDPGMGNLIVGLLLSLHFFLVKRRVHSS